MQKPKKDSALRRTIGQLGLTKITGWAILGLGALALAVSIVYSSSTLAIIGLGMIFWGVILTYIRNEEYVKELIFQSVGNSSFSSLNHILQQMGYSNKAIYLPPRYFKDPETSKAYLPKQQDEKPPTPEQIQTQEMHLFTENPKGMLTTPPGLELTKLFEKRLETSFTKEDLSYVERNLPKLLTEDLEIAQSVEIRNEATKITIRIENSPFSNLCNEAKAFTNAYNVLGSPLASALACALAKATGKCIIIQKETTDNKNIEIEYKLLPEEPPKA
jgi:hypothetical protein